MLIRHLPAESAAVTAINGGDPAWGSTEHLLADLWALLVRVNSPAKAEPVDHPVRASMSAKARAKSKAKLKATFLARKATLNKEV